MNIFFIIILVGLVLSIPFCIMMLITADNIPAVAVKQRIIGVIVCLLAWIVFVTIGIGINTHYERLFVKKFLAQKETIERSFENDNLTGLERIQLVSKATDINGEMAERKARFELWYFVVFDNTIYDNVELIKLWEEEE